MGFWWTVIDFAIYAYTDPTYLERMQFFFTDLSSSIYEDFTQPELPYPAAADLTISKQIETRGYYF